MQFLGLLILVQYLVEGMTSSLLTRQIATIFLSQILATLGNTLPSGVQDKKTILARSIDFSPGEVEVFYLG